MNLFVGNLNPDTVSDSLRILFSEFGKIVSSKVIYDNTTGISKGFGFVDMEDNHASFDAINNLDQTFFEGNIISVKEAKQNNPPVGQGGNNRSSTGFGKKPSFRPRTPRDGSSRPPRDIDGNYNRL